MRNKKLATAEAVGKTKNPCKLVSAYFLQVGDKQGIDVNKDREVSTIHSCCL